MLVGTWKGERGNESDGGAIERLDQWIDGSMAFCLAGWRSAWLGGGGMNPR